MENAKWPMRAHLRKGEQSKQFLREEDLVEALILKGKRLAKGMTHRRLNVICEFDTSVGRADVVFFYLRKNWRKHLKYGRLPHRWVYALKALPFRTTFTADEFALMSAVSRDTAIEALRRYERMGYCRRSSKKGLWVKVKQPILVVNKIVAIEAKLTDWKRALSQAYRYQRYASQAWVVLDASKARGAIAAKNAFRRLNVGLKVLNLRGKARTYVNPRLSKPKSLPHFWEANGLIAASLCRL